MPSHCASRRDCYVSIMVDSCSRLSFNFTWRLLVIAMTCSSNGHCSRSGENHHVDSTATDNIQDRCGVHTNGKMKHHEGPHHLRLFCNSTKQSIIVCQHAISTETSNCKEIDSSANYHHGSTALSVLTLMRSSKLSARLPFSFRKERLSGTCVDTRQDRWSWTLVLYQWCPHSLYRSSFWISLPLAKS